MIKLPPNGQWNQTNRSDILGSLVGSFNLDLTANLGNTLVNRMIQTTTQVTDTNLTSYPVGFKAFGSSIVTVAGSYTHRIASNIITTPFTVNLSGPTDCDSTSSDIEVFVDSIYVTANQKLYKSSDGISYGSTSFGASGPNMMSVFPTQQRLYFTAGSKVFSTADGTTIATSGANTINIGTNSSLLFTAIRSSSNRIWLGVLNINNDKGYVVEWDGVATSATKYYRLESAGVISMVIKDDIPWIVDTNGRLLTYSGGTFKEMARFPIDDKFLTNSLSLTNNRPVHPNGMTLVNGKINILLNNVINNNASSIPEFCPSGIWEYDENIGLYHKYSLSYLPVGTNTITDYGQNRISGAGGLAEMKLLNTNVTATGNLLAGATIYTNASSTDAGVFINDTFDAVTGTTGQKATQGFGYFVTVKVNAEGIQDTWQRLCLSHEKFLTASDKIIIKYKIQEIPAVEGSITWASTTGFSTTTDLSNFAVGDEVEITQGTGGGLCAHIVTLQTGASSTYLVTLDETFTGVTTGTAKARFQKWIKAGTIQDVRTFDAVQLGISSDYIQLKVCMLFTGKNTFSDMTLINKPYQLE